MAELCRGLLKCRCTVPDLKASNSTSTSIHRRRVSLRPKARSPLGHRLAQTLMSLSSIISRRVSLFVAFSSSITKNLVEYPQIQLNPNLPVVNVGNKENPSYLPAEVCFVLPGQTIKRRLSPDQTAQMILAACRKPNENGNSIIGDGRNVLGLNPSANSMAVSLSILTFLNFTNFDSPNLVLLSRRLSSPLRAEY